MAVIYEDAPCIDPLYVETFKTILCHTSCIWIKGESRYYYYGVTVCPSLSVDDLVRIIKSLKPFKTT